MQPTSDTDTPFALPTSWDLADYRRDLICYLSQFNYKLEAQIGPTADSQQMRLTVLDTGAGPNLVRADILLQRLLTELDRSREIVNLASASKHRLDVLGITTLSVTVGTHTVRLPFIAVRKLGTYVILGCHYMDKAVDTIQVQQRHVILVDSSRVRIIRRRAVVPMTQGSSEPTTVQRRSAASPNAIRCAQRIILEPRSETNMSVTCLLGGLKLLEAWPALYNKRMVCLSNGLSEVQPDVPFTVKVANLSDARVLIPKNQRVGLTLQAPVPDQVHAISFEG